MKAIYLSESDFREGGMVFWVQKERSFMFVYTLVLQFFSLIPLLISPPSDAASLFLSPLTPSLVFTGLFVCACLSFVLPACLPPAYPAKILSV
jgi:hypothetical protein